MTLLPPWLTLMHKLDRQQLAVLHLALLELRTALRELLENSSASARAVSLDEPIG